MKRFLSTFIFSLIILQATAAEKEGYKIKARIKGLKDTVCYLAYHYGDKQYLKDTAQVDSKGNMFFQGKEKLPGGIYMVVLPAKNYFEILINDQFFSLETDTSDYVKNMKFSNSKENTLFYEYLRYVNKKGREADKVRKELEKIKDQEDNPQIQELREQLGEVEREINEFRDNYIKEYPDSFLATVFRGMKDPEVPEPPLLENGKVDSTFKFKYYKEHFFDNIDFTDDRILRTPVYHGKIKQYFEKLTLQYPDSLIAAADYLIEKSRANKELFKYTVFYVTYNIETSKLMGADKVFVHLADKYYKTNQAYWLDSAQTARIVDKAKKLKPILIGKKAPELKMRDINGNIKSLHGVDKKYTIIYFYDPNCGHCKKVTPKLRDLRTRLKDKIETFAVCLDPDEEQWKKYIEDNKLDWINVTDPYNQTNFRKTYDINSTPIIYLLDENKEIVAKRIDVEQLGDLLDRLLEKDEDEPLLDTPLEMRQPK
ncbi:thioredoxin-like domain-containing protein [Cytophagaceae bacterium ABcell3]|nr:thioredoxin-like domain-containing protein [Cytophagaceae bacterium ABcell3]